MTVSEVYVKALFYTLADKLSEIKAKTLPYTLGHVDSEAVLDKLAGSHVFAGAGQKCYRHTDTLLDVELKTLGNTLADKMTKAPFDAVVDTVAEMEAATLGNNTSRCESGCTTSCSGLHNSRGRG